jgi:hypothetical protein
MAAVLTVVTLGCASGSSSSAHTDSSTSSTAASDRPTSIAQSGAIVASTVVAVRNRAARPEETTSPGIQFKSGALQVNIGQQQFVINAADWNTITRASVVPINVGLQLDPDIHPDATTRQRFQYLADLFDASSQATFLPIGLVGALVGNNYVEIVGLYNPTPDIAELSGLHTALVAKSSSNVLGAAVFFSGANGGLTLPAHSVVFERLRLPTSSPRYSGSTVVSFHWDRLMPCGQRPCH